MKSIRTFLGALLLAVLSFTALAQVYPINNPGYLPNAILAQSTVSATGTTTFITNGVDTLYLRIGGSPASFTANMQGTESRATGASYTSLGVTNVTTGARQASITGTGLYRMDVAGLASVQLNVSALSGTLTASMSAGIGNSLVHAQPTQRRTYAASTSTFTAAASATDIMVLYGNANTTTRLVQASCTGQGSATSAVTVDLVKRSTATTGGTSTTLTVAPFDSGDAAAGSTVGLFTANGTTGTLVGSLGQQRLIASTVASPTNAAPQVAWNFGSGTDSFTKQVTLRGAAQAVALNLAGATLTNGTTLNCAMVWTEE